MKPNSVAVISNNQPKETLQTLIERSVEKQVSKMLFDFKSNFHLRNLQCS